MKKALVFFLVGLCVLVGSGCQEEFRFTPVVEETTVETRTVTAFHATVDGIPRYALDDVYTCISNILYVRPDPNDPNDTYQVYRGTDGVDDTCEPELLAISKARQTDIEVLN